MPGIGSSFSGYKKSPVEEVKYVPGRSDTLSRVRELQQAVSTLALEIEHEAALEAEPLSIMRTLSDYDSSINSNLANSNAVVSSRLADTNSLIKSSLVDPSAQIKGGLMIKGSRDVYTGSYNIVPQTYQQVMYTAEKVMTDNVVIEQIPIWETSNTSGGKTVYIAGDVTIL